MAIYMMREAPVYTIVWSETSTPSSSFVKYEDAAVWMTQWSTDWDTIFWYSAVKLSSSWTESAEVNQSSPWVLDITQLWTLTSGDNVMIKFPVMWIKMSRSGSQVTLSITPVKWLEGEWFQYYAFQKTWDIEANATTTVETKTLYLWAYLGCMSSNILKSWSWATYSSSYSMANHISYAANNGAWWTIMWWYQRCLIIAYYMIKYWRLDSQVVIWKWKVDGGSMASTWGTNSQTNATYWTTSTSNQMKIFGLEDFWGNSRGQRIWWAITDSSRNLYTSLHDFTTSITADYKNAWSVAVSQWSYQYWNLSKVLWTNKWMFWPMQVINNTSYNTYYSDFCSAWADKIPVIWARTWEQEWIFWANILAYNVSSYDNAITSRLMYL